MDLVPVVLDKLPRLVHRRPVASEGSEDVEDVLGAHGPIDAHLEQPVHQRRLLGEAERTQRTHALLSHGGVLVHLEHLVKLGSPTRGNDDRVHGKPEVCVHLVVALSEALPCLSSHGLVAIAACHADDEGAKKGPEGRLPVLGVPPNGPDNLACDGHEKLLELRHALLLGPHPHHVAQRPREVSPHRVVGFFAIPVSESQGDVCRELACLGKGEGISLHCKPVDSREGEVLYDCPKRREQLLRVAHAVEPSLPHVCLDPASTSDGARGSASLCLEVNRPTCRSPRAPDRHWHPPHGAATILAICEEPLLREGQPAAPITCHRHHGIPNLLGPDAHELCHILARRSRQGAPEVNSLGVAVLVLSKVGADALLEEVHAKVVGDHHDDGSALAVGDLIEDLIHLARPLHLNLDGMR
mmetsp:Transcript_61721/g.151937  ORF Transcript_61721/g.151937 Transcript_61721/m.151937 type:complete len:413 (+) Transcript_61721:383-1621(+)